MKYLTICALILPLAYVAAYPQVPVKKTVTVNAIYEMHNVPEDVDKIRDIIMQNGVFARAQELLRSLPDMSVAADAEDDAVVPDMSVASDAFERNFNQFFEMRPDVFWVHNGQHLFESDADFVPDMSVASDADDTPLKPAGENFKIFGRPAMPTFDLKHSDDADLIPDISVAADADDVPADANLIPDISEASDANDETNIDADADFVPDMSVASDADNTPLKPAGENFKVFGRPAMPTFGGKHSDDADLIPDISVAADADDVPADADLIPDISEASDANDETNIDADADLVPDMSVASDADNTPLKPSAEHFKLFGRPAMP